MIIIAGYVTVDPAQRDAAVKSFVGLVEQARKQEGCLDMSISPDSVAPDRVNLFERWRDRETLDAWRKIARAPHVERRETCVHLYRTDRAEAPF